MNRRELLKTLAALPAVKSIEVANIKADDVIVIESEALLSNEHRQQIAHYVQNIWPQNKCLVLSKGMHIKTARG
jgi:hypothetical protein